MSRRFVTSDHHFGDKKIIGYENRPFQSVEHMNLDLIGRWNSVVGKHDTVIHLGDFSFLPKKETKDILARLNGRKVLILGNHDRGRSVNWWREVGFDQAYEYPIILDGFYILSHEPVYVSENMPYVNVHGHTHNKRIDHQQIINVSVECTDYKPVLWDSIKTRFASEGEQAE